MATQAYRDGDWPAGRVLSPDLDNAITCSILLEIRTLFLWITLFASTAAEAAGDHYTATLTQSIDKKRELIV